MSDQKDRNTSDIIQETGRFSCPVQKAAYYIDTFIRELMCGKCFPCALGTYETAIMLRDFMSGHAANTDIDALGRIADAMLISSRCKRGRDTALFMSELLKEKAFSEHVGGQCPAHECTSFIEYRIVPERCIMCGECQAVCAYHAILGEKKVPYLSGYLPFEILSKRCTGCGECAKICPVDAIIMQDKRENLVVADL